MSEGGFAGFWGSGLECLRCVFQGGGIESFKPGEHSKGLER